MMMMPIDPQGRPLLVRGDFGYYCAFQHRTLIIRKRSWRQLWSERWWVICIHCDLEDGPHPSKKVAHIISKGYDEPKYKNVIDLRTQNGNI